MEIFKQGKKNCWPLLAIPANLAPWDRCRSKNALLLGIIGGKNPKAHEFQRYLELFEEELEELANGIRALKPDLSPIIIKAGVVAYVMDSRASEKVMLTSAGGAAKSICWGCKCRGRYIKAYKKSVYDDVRRFLRPRHWMRFHIAWGTQEGKVRLCKPRACNIRMYTYTIYMLM